MCVSIRHVDMRRGEEYHLQVNIFQQLISLLRKHLIKK